MNKKIVTLVCVTVLSGFVAGVNADELSLGGSVASKEDNAGLVVAEQPKEEPGKGIVVAVGPGKMENGTLVPLELQVGQKVVYKKYSGTEIKENQKEYLLIEAENILAIVE